MRIGILTLSASDNCGSLLQAYALRLALKKYGDVEIINFSSKESHIMYDIPKYGLADRIKHYKKVNSLRRASKDYKHFRHAYLKIEGKEFFAEDLERICHKYDVLVVGSDQVWNVEMVDFNPAFFLGWTSAKKIAYAPSLGGRNLNMSENFDEIKNWLKEFYAISVREEMGKKCLEDVTGRFVPKVIDPTLLVQEEEWSKLVGTPMVRGDYIFYYSWAYCEDGTSRIVADMSKKLGIPVYVIDARKWISRDINKWGFLLYKSTGPLAFLNLMKHAKICYVESFHGMVFSYIFKKNFWLLDTHSDVNHMDSRLMEFVNLLDAKDRILTPYNAKDIDQEEIIDYKKNVTLEDMRNNSWNYLNQAFGEE